MTAAKKEKKYNYLLYNNHTYMIKKKLLRDNYNSKKKEERENKRNIVHCLRREKKKMKHKLERGRHWEEIIHQGSAVAKTYPSRPDQIKLGEREKKADKEQDGDKDEIRKLPLKQTSIGLIRGGGWGWWGYVGIEAFVVQQQHHDLGKFCSKWAGHK